MENMGEEGKNTYWLGGREKREWTPAEAADWVDEQYLPALREASFKREWTPAEAADWVDEQYLPALRKASVTYPEGWLFSGCSIPTPDLTPDELEKQMYENVELGEKGKVGSFMGNVKGKIKMENMGEEGKNTYLLGGGEKREWTPAEAADWFAEQYLQDLREVSVRFPEGWLFSGCSIPTADLPPDELEKQMYENVELGEKVKVGSFMGNVKGDNAEHEMYKYLTRIPETSRTALFVNYKFSMFRRFTGQPHKDQEFDIVLVFGELRKWLTIEVKAGQKGGAGWADQLMEGKIFYKEVLAATGIDTQDWEYIPVGAFPNAQNQNQVKGVQKFLNENRNGLVITKHEMSRALEDLLPNGPKYEIDETYLTLVKWLMASAHCSKSAASLSLTPSDHVKETKEKLVGSNTSDLGVGVSDDPGPPAKKTKWKLVGSNTSDLGVGVSEDPGPSSSTITLSSSKGKPVGSQESILFWNKDQAQFLFQDNPRCIIKGEFGSGKKENYLCITLFFCHQNLHGKVCKIFMVMSSKFSEVTSMLL
ncbi:uncharacterized protein LOC111713252 [Eurytemora carolleeae]|uniref:uncharacterized protein LOC111713252 n=1 Tax=Eurytemora carolleeae TaxID=1294199 RepID=UPI000C77FC13|nr:uncharacterized protein LOC111713252 [Eurytemora carolleeae]|eukprot:XP_023343853.1 uncharacterized protein LOC111713252 [Eurytemora affinis]